MNNSERCVTITDKTTQHPQRQEAPCFSRNTNDDDASEEEEDELMKMISFTSLRNSDGLETGITFSWPGIPDNTVVTLSTLLDPCDMAPLFSGAQWAGTRVWHAAIAAIHYLDSIHTTLNNDDDNKLSLLELGAGLGIPGMIWYLLGGGDVVLTDQEDIMSQLQRNITFNFAPNTDNDNIPSTTLEPTNRGATIQAYPLTWSRSNLQTLLTRTNHPNGFDIVLHCDCIYEPLYGKSWISLLHVINECLQVNPNCMVLSSVERRMDDGMDAFLERMQRSDFVGSVEKVDHRLWNDNNDNNCIELYVTRGKATHLRN